jgi:8-oxo-dGTP pyrophosphatase MutT (NUDIX family)
MFSSTGGEVMLREVSAGATVFYLGSQIEYLLLHYAAGHWDFPKGAIEPGEPELDTVRREVWEETGIREIEIIPGFRKVIHYWYRKSGQPVQKTVIFYLARSLTKNVTLSYEHIGYVWLPYEEGLKRLTFKSAKGVLQEANEYLLRIFREFIPR